MVIRQSVPEDMGRVQGLAAQFVTSFELSAADFVASFSALSADPDACLLVAELDTGVVGYLLGFKHLTFFANGAVGWVEELMVANEHRRSGVGRSLMSAFEAWAAKSECRLVALATRRAAAFYEAIGYESSATYFRKLL